MFSPFFHRFFTEVFTVFSRCFHGSCHGSCHGSFHGSFHTCETGLNKKHEQCHGNHCGNSLCIPTECVSVIHVSISVFCSHTASLLGGCSWNIARTYDPICLTEVFSSFSTEVSRNCHSSFHSSFRTSIRTSVHTNVFADGDRTLWCSLRSFPTLERFIQDRSMHVLVFVSPVFWVIRFSSLNAVPQKCLARKNLTQPLLWAGHPE